MDATKDSRWIAVTSPEDLPEREGRAVEFGGREIALFKLGGRYFAIDNRCPHSGGPLADGIVTGRAVVCPLHGWKVCLDSGKVSHPEESPACVASYRTRVRSGLVWIEVPEDLELARSGREEVAA